MATIAELLKGRDLRGISFFSSSRREWTPPLLFYSQTDASEKELRNVPFLDLFFRYYETGPEETIREIDDFIEHCGVFEDKERDLVVLALVIATVGHQYNLNLEKRDRKTGKPYLHHPLAQANRLLNEGFDYLTVSAALLHDVPEDVNLGKGLARPEEWLDFFRETFNAAGETLGIAAGFNQDKKVGDLLAEIIAGKTEKKFSAEQLDELYLELSRKPLWKAFAAFVERGGVKASRDNGRSISEETKRRLMACILNLERTFSLALLSPDHWRIFLLWTADIWQNLQTPEWVRVEKILRGRVAAGLAEYFGWYQMRSDLIWVLSQVTDTLSPYRPVQEDEERMLVSEALVKKFLEDEEKRARSVFQKFCKVFHLEPAEPVENRYLPFLGWPYFPSYAHRQRFLKDSSLASPEAILFFTETVWKKIEEKLKSPNYPGKSRFPYLNFYLQMSSFLNRSGFSLFHFRFLQEPSFAQMLGRKRIQYWASFGKRGGCRYRLEEGETPYLVGLFQRESKSVVPSDIPEAALFGWNSRDSEHWGYHLEKLTAFFYDPGLPFLSGVNAGETRILLWGEKAIFISKKMNFGDIAQIFGKRPEKLRVTFFCGTKVLSPPFDQKKVADLFDFRYLRGNPYLHFVRVEEES